LQHGGMHAPDCAPLFANASKLPRARIPCCQRRNCLL
jgi:hypothetical protein